MKSVVHWNKQGESACKLSGSLTSNRMLLTCGRCKAIVWRLERRDWSRRHGGFVEECSRDILRPDGTYGPMSPEKLEDDPV